MRRSRTRLRAGLLLSGLAALVAVASPSAQSGGITSNGSSTADANGNVGLVIPGFLFEPEVPLASLKTLPIWNELEQLLDDPYKVAPCSTLSPAVDALVRNTPGTTQITGSPSTPIYPAYCTTTVVRRPGFGVTLPPLIVHPLNYNPTDGEEMRLLNPGFIGGNWIVPDELVQPAPVLLPNLWSWTYRRVRVTRGAGRVEGPEIDYNAPIRPDTNAPLALFSAAAGSNTVAGLVVATAALNVPPAGTCIASTEVFPPEGDTMCGGDPGEPGYLGFGTLGGILTRGLQYSLPAVPGVVSPSTAITTQRLFDATRGTILARTASGTGGLRKPSIRIAPASSNGAPNYLVNANPNDVTPSSENDYVRDRDVAVALGKALFWDMQVGSDTVQSCGSCHAHAGADNRTKNQLNPNHLGDDLDFEVRQPNQDLTTGDFPFHKLASPDIAGDPRCATPITAQLNPGVLENPPSASSTICSAGNAISNKNNANGTKVTNDVASSMGVHFGRFLDIPTPNPISAFGPPSAIGGVRSLLPDLRSTVPADNVDPIPGFGGTGGHDIRRVEPRNTPTIFAAALNFDNFWDGRARHDFNGGSVFGASDPQAHVFVQGTGGLVPTRQIIRFVSLASLATGPALSEFEMSFLGRNWAKIGKKLLQAGVTPLANQLVSPTDSILGPYSNQPGNPNPSPLCPAAALSARVAGKPGLCAPYDALVRAAFFPALHQNTSSHLEGCYTDGRPDIHNQCSGGVVPVFGNPSNTADPFDGYKLSVAPGPPSPTNTSQFTQMEANFSLFFGLSIHTWVTMLMPDDTPFDRFLDRNPDMFESIGEVGEPGLVGPLPVCTTATQRHCFREVGRFKRDAAGVAPFDCNALPGTGETGGTVSITPCFGTRSGGQPDPLLGMDIFQGSNLSLKNPNFRAARCGECHAGATLTDNTMPFTFKAVLGDFIGEFLSPGNEALIEPLGRPRVISGFLLESEMNENGQDAVERRLINQSIAPCPSDGLAYPGGLDGGSGQGFGLCSGAAQSFFDNGVYNLGVTRCSANQSQVTGACDDTGRGGTDAFGWPLSLAALLIKNLGGASQEPGTPLAAFDPSLGGGGGLFEETAQDPEINPGESGEQVSPELPAYLAPFASEINVGDTSPELDELHGGLNTLTDVAMLEGFIDILGPFNPAGLLNESMNNGEGEEMGTWPIVNRVGRFGSFKAPQLREVELTGPYFHNGGKLTLRQVVDFYARGGDFPATNATHRDFNIVNLNFEVQSNLTEAEKVALVDFLLELTDDRVLKERAPFDHPEVILPLDGTAPENGSFTVGTTTNVAFRDAALRNCTASALGPGQRACMNAADGTTKLFLDVPAVGASGNSVGLPNFLGICSRPGQQPDGSACSSPLSHFSR